MFSRCGSWLWLASAPTSPRVAGDAARAAAERPTRRGAQGERGSGPNPVPGVRGSSRAVLTDAIPLCTTVTRAFVQSTSDGEGEEEVRQALALLHVLSGADGPAVDAALLPGPEQERRVPNSEVVLNGECRGRGVGGEVEVGGARSTTSTTTTVSSATCHLCKRERHESHPRSRGQQ